MTDKEIKNMTNPWLPPYLGSWEQLIAASLHNPLLGTEPSPLPWRLAVGSLLTSISLRQVASKMPDGKAKTELGRRVDNAILEFIDGCGTDPHPGSPWPWPGPLPWVYPIVAELVTTANAITDGTVRDEAIRVAGQIMERASGSVGRRDVQVPTSEELDAITVSSSSVSDCEVLCDDFLDTLGELKGAKGTERAILLARLRALRKEMKELKCKPCRPS